MKRISTFVVIWLLLMVPPMQIPKNSATKISFDISPVKPRIESLPGAIISVPVRVTNTGESPLNNLTISLVWELENGLYVVNRTVQIGVNESRVFDLTLKVPDLPSGEYNLTVRGLLGNVTIEKRLSLYIRPQVTYSLSIDVGDRYIYGNDVEIKFSLVSHSNDRIIGPIWMRVYRNGTLVEDKAEIRYIDPNEKWDYTMVLQRPKIGIYSVKLAANMSGVYREVEKTFVVYRRRFTYRAWYSDGELKVLVKLINGSPVKGIEVTVNGLNLKTDENGLVRYPTASPGLYEIQLNLDGVVEKTALYVGRLFINYEVKGEALRLKVLDSNGNPVPNVTLSIAGPRGEYSAATDEKGEASISINALGYGTISITATSENYVGSSLTIAIPSPSITTTTTASSSTTTTTTSQTTTTTSSQPPTNVKGNVKGKSGTSWSEIGTVLLGLIIFSGTSYLSFMRPHIIKEELGRYYFVKLRAPRLVPLRNFRWEKGMNAVEVRTTKGTAKIEGSRVVWSIDELEPGEEAVLQVVLG